MENVSLNGGLDLVRARPATLAGRIRQCLNYEVGWQRGYARIDGWERFDGHTSPSATDYWIVIVPDTHVVGTPIDQVTDLKWELQGESDHAGVLVEYAGAPAIGTGLSLFAIVFRQDRLRPPWDSVISDREETWSFALTEGLVTVQKLSALHDTHEEFLEKLSEYTEKLRAVVRPVPGGGTIVGLHYHEDQLYAIRDANRVSVPEGDVDKLIPGMYVYNDAGQVGEVLTADPIENQYHIAAVDADGFELNEGDAIHVALTIRFKDGSGEFSKGVVVRGLTSNYQATTGYIERRDGSFESDNALGVVALINGSETLVAELFETFEDITDATNTFVLEAVQFEPNHDATTVETKYLKADVAAIWKSTDDGWVAAAAGRVLQFDTGTNDPTLDTPVPQTSVKFPGTVEIATVTDFADWSGDINSIKAIGGGSITAVPLGGGIWTSAGYTDSLIIKDFKVGLFDDDVITGLSLDFNARNDPTAPGTGSLSASLLDIGSGSRGVTLLKDAAFSPHIVGADGDTWTTQELTPEHVNSEAFGFQFNGKTSHDHAFISVDAVRVTVYFTAVPGATLYLWDDDLSVDVGTISVRDTVVQSGGFGTDDAKGYFRLKDWSIVDIPANTEIWTKTGGTGLFIANAVGDIARPVLPGSKKLDANHSRYQMISYNFFASEDRNAIYGVNGAGPAFWYDGTTLDFILTGVDIEKDKPRHIAPHQHRLALGYIWGEVYTSEPGEPTKWDGALFAGTFGFGDKITGLMPIAGDALAVFTESSTNTLLGAPGADQGAEQKVINHKVGAIEYTVQNIGNRPIFASFRGIETMETMDQFSDFFTAPLTYDVSPWLLDRLQSAAGVETTDKSVVNSVVVRNKNQYRLFFADGYVLTLTYVGPEKEPQNTIQQYWFNSDRLEYARCYATASGVTTRGKDRAFYSVEARPSTPNTKTLGAPEIDYVYELDRGRSFDGGTIEANFLLTYNFTQQQQAPMFVKRYNVLHIHGTVAGYASLRVSRAVNYEDIDAPVLPYEDAYFGALSHPPQEEIHAKYAKARLTSRGFAVSVYVSHESAIEFPHNVQMLTFLDDAATKADR